MSKTVSVIIPSYNEEGNIPRMYSELISLSKRIKKYQLKMVFINDCSSDKTLDILKKIKNKNKKVTIVDLKQRSGEWVGFKVALKYINSDYVTSLPADLQIPTSIIKKFLRKIEANKNLDVVYADGYPHGNGVFAIIYWSWLFLRFNKKLVNKQVDTFLMNKKMLDIIKKKNNFHNVVPLEIFKSGNYGFVRFRKKPRKAEGSKYNLLSKMKLFLETVLLSLNIDLFGYKKPRYRIF